VKQRRENLYHGRGWRESDGKGRPAYAPPVAVIFCCRILVAKPALRRDKLAGGEDDLLGRAIHGPFSVRPAVYGGFAATNVV